MDAIYRRNLLRGITAGLASVPALSALYGGKVRANDDIPKRLCIYWTPNGCVASRFFPTSSSDLTSSETLAPLAPHNDDLVVLRTTFDGTGDHKFGLPFSTTGRAAVIQDDEESGVSIDQEIANAIGIPSLVLAGQTKDNRRGYISADANGSRVSPTRDPADAFAQVIGPGGGGGGGSGPSPADTLARQHVLDTVKEDIDSLKAKVATSERQILEGHLAAVDRLSAGLMGGGGGVDCDDAIAPASGLDYAGRVAGHINLIATAFACDARRVASFMTAPAGHDNCNFGFIGVSGGDLHQSIAHSSRYDDEFNTASDHMVNIGSWHAQGLADLIQLLKDTPESDGSSVFDHTTILWTNECATGNHGHRPIPVVLAGTMGGYIKNGMYLEEELRGSTDYRSILTTLANGMGHPINTFGAGDPSGLADILLA